MAIFKKSNPRTLTIPRAQFEKEITLAGLHHSTSRPGLSVLIGNIYLEETRVAHTNTHTKHEDYLM